MDIATFAVLAGRIVIAVALIVSGTRMLMARKPLGDLLTAQRIPYPEFVAVGGGIVEIVVGVLLILGWWLPWTALFLAAFIVAATVMVHDFWNKQGADRVGHVNTAIGNAIIVGALLIVAGLSS